MYGDIVRGKDFTLKKLIQIELGTRPTWDIMLRVKFSNQR